MNLDGQWESPPPVLRHHGYHKGISEAQVNKAFTNFINKIKTTLTNPDLVEVTTKFVKILRLTLTDALDIIPDFGALFYQNFTCKCFY